MGFFLSTSELADGTKCKQTKTKFLWPSRAPSPSGSLVPYSPFGGESSRFVQGKFGVV
jgi:hypothetical protein